MRKTQLIGIVVVVPVAFLVLLAMAAPAKADGKDKGGELKAKLRGVQEVPAVSTGASGEFRGDISKDGSSIDFELSYEGLEGNVTQAHIHLAQRGVNGGIMLFLCTNLAPPAGVPLPQPCPPSPGKVEGTLTAANVFGAATAQGIVPGEGGVFEEIVRAIRQGVTYANVHSASAGGVAGNFNGGEIRGQIRARHDDD